MKKIIIVIVCIVLFTQCHGKKEKAEAIIDESGNHLWVKDSEKFALEYPLVGGDNIFVYRTAGQTAQILEKGTGVVFIGFKECSWCRLYAVFLHDVAIEMKMQRIFYCDIREDRLNNTEDYQRIVGILDGLLQYDDEGRSRVYVPDVTIVDNGKIIGRDFETSKVTLGYETAEEYWNEERVTALKERLSEGMGQVSSKTCNACD